MRITGGEGGWGRGGHPPLMAEISTPPLRLKYTPPLWDGLYTPPLLFCPWANFSKLQYVESFQGLDFDPSLHNGNVNLYIRQAEFDTQIPEFDQILEFDTQILEFDT